MPVAVNIWAAVVCALWGALLWIGIGLISGVVAQHVPGYPNTAQILFYIGAPAAVVTTLLCSGIALNCIKKWQFAMPAFLIFSILVFLLLFPYIWAYGGGM